MTAKGEKEAGFEKTWRYKIGLFMIVVGNGGILLAVSVLPFLGLSAAVIGAIVVGGEVVSLASIVFLGKEGFKAIKAKLFGAVKAGYTAPVGRARHYAGIALLFTNVLTTYATMLYAWTAFEASTARRPMPEIWGLDFTQQGTLVLWLFLIGEISFLVAIYVLGAEWWGRFRDLIVWNEPDEQLTA